MKTKTVSWFSAGGDSAVATKLVINQIDEIIYLHIDDQHPDTMRFVKDCETWFNKKVQILQSPFKNVESVCLYKKYINGIAGASCTGILKRLVRQQWEYEQPLDIKLRYIWGMDCTEKHRRDDPEHGLLVKMPNQEHLFPLIDNQFNKKDVHGILAKAGIKRPLMYDMGYNNNNCVGCIKGGQWYWNKIRKDFPEVFKRRAEMERKIGASCINGIYLDELNPKAGKKDKGIMPECGIMCEMLKL